MNFPYREDLTPPEQHPVESHPDVTHGSVLHLIPYYSSGTCSTLFFSFAEKGKAVSLSPEAGSLSATYGPIELYSFGQYPHRQFKFFQKSGARLFSDFKIFDHRKFEN